MQDWISVIHISSESTVHLQEPVGICKRPVFPAFRTIHILKILQIRITRNREEHSSHSMQAINSEQAKRIKKYGIVMLNMNIMDVNWKTDQVRRYESRSDHYMNMNFSEFIKADDNDEKLLKN